MAEPAITLIVPTHNRADSLRHTLVSAQALDYPADRLEILVVDNASGDATVAVAQEFASPAHGPPVRYLREDRLGLHHARHAGARAAGGDILLFTDDDATFTPGWVRAYDDAFLAHPEMAAAGGPVEPVWEHEPPPWLLDFMGDYRDGFMILSIWDPHKEFRLEPGGFFFYGVNLAIRREALFRAGGFNPEAFGGAWLGDGETGLNRKLAVRGEHVGFVPAARVYHHIPAGRMTAEYFCRRMANEGACEMYAEFHQAMPSRWGLARKALGIVRRNWRAWRTARALRGLTDAESLGAQMDAARTRSQFAYTVRTLCSGELRRLILKEDWLNDAACGLASPDR